MSDASVVPPGGQLPPRPAPAAVVRRSADWGSKAIIVFLLAALMAIPAFLVFLLVADRTTRANNVVEEISSHQGGAQQLLGPLLVVPYTIPAQGDQQAQTLWYVISPERGEVNAQLTASSLHRGLFDVPVFQVQRAVVTAHFGPRPQSLSVPANAVVDWTGAQLYMGYSDLRGAQSDVVGQVTTAAGRQAVTFSPDGGNLGQPPTQPGASSGRNFGVVSAPATMLENGGDFTAQVAFTGARRLSVMPFARSTTVRLTGNWSSPSFDGGFVPTSRTVTSRGFEAVWRVPFLARGLAAEGTLETLGLPQLAGQDVGVSLVRNNDPYQSVTRALKYAVMFVGLVFLTFFVFEALSGKRLHPAQYILIGLAQMVFYLLLLSASEWVGFDIAFAGASLATVALIGLYAGAAFRSRSYQVQALVIFSIVYALIYLLMRLEDLALLAGSLAAFVGLSVAMWLTRNLDWYGGRAAEVKPAVAPPAASPAAPLAAPPAAT